MWREPALHICLSLLSLSVTHNPSVSQVCLFDGASVCASRLPFFPTTDRYWTQPASSRALLVCLNSGLVLRDVCRLHTYICGVSPPIGHLLGCGRWVCRRVCVCTYPCLRNNTL